MVKGNNRGNTHKISKAKSTIDIIIEADYLFFKLIVFIKKSLDKKLLTKCFFYFYFLFIRLFSIRMLFYGR